MTGGNLETSSINSFRSRSKQTLILVPKKFGLQQADLDFPAGDLGSFQKVFDLGNNQVLAICAIRKGHLIEVQIPLHNLGEA